MAFAVIMPKAGMSMEHGTIIRWLKKVGDEVRAGEALLEIETDKVAMEVEAEAAGVLLRITRGEGEEVAVTETIGYIGVRGEEIAEATPPVPSVAGRVAATPRARTLARERGVNLASVVPSGGHGEVKARDVDSASPADASVKASPLARAVAEREGVDLSGVHGSGRRGKILKEDVITASADKRGESPNGGGEKRWAMTSVRRVTAARMQEAHLSIPAVTLHAEADVTGLMLLKIQILEQTGHRYSINDFILRAASRTARDYPAVMARLDEGRQELVQPAAVNLGVAVSVEDALYVPVIRNAAELSLEEIAVSAQELIERARGKRLRPDDLTGATFSVTNLGMYGIISFNPMINPPESSILGVGAVRPVLELSDGAVVERKKMYLSLTIDHRIIDGAVGATFLAHLRELLESPVRLLV
ncbi:MAG TPA: dihydrolipoamide acetyltransferase family protein [Spirochaetia bacterium]|nr:dihydrolipoamide acetyltransferase family protein [Spirochaetia bacterium]